jgi:uncharacterized protein (TIGR02246 family)
MNDLEALMVKWRCEELITRYAMAVNDWDLDAFVALFTPDAVWQRPAVAALHGHAAIRTFMEAQPANRVLRHVNGGILVEPVDQDRARAWSQTTVYEDRGTTVVPARVGPPDMVVEYRDDLVRQDGQWRIARRDTTVVFRSDLPGPVVPAPGT